MSLEQADYNLTEAAMQGGGARGLGDETLLVKFFINPRQDMAETALQNRPIFRDCEYIQIIQPGNKDSIIRRPAMDMDKARFPEHYKRFKAREDQESMEGTPLEHWTGVTKSQCAELRYMHVLTVEQLAGMTDVNAQGFMGISQLRENAKRFLTAADSAKLGNVLAEKDEQIAAMQARLDALERGDAHFPPSPELQQVVDAIAPPVEETGVALMDFNQVADIEDGIEEGIEDEPEPEPEEKAPKAKRRKRAKTE